MLIEAASRRRCHSSVSVTRRGRRGLFGSESGDALGIVDSTINGTRSSSHGRTDETNLVRESTHGGELSNCNSHGTVFGAIRFPKDVLKIKFFGVCFENKGVVNLP